MDIREDEELILSYEEDGRTLYLTDERLVSDGDDFVDIKLENIESINKGRGQHDNVLSIIGGKPSEQTVMFVSEEGTVVNIVMKEADMFVNELKRQIE